VIDSELSPRHLYRNGNLGQKSGTPQLQAKSSRDPICSFAEVLLPCLEEPSIAFLQQRPLLLSPLLPVSSLSVEFYAGRASLSPPPGTIHVGQQLHPLRACASIPRVRRVLQR
jgi:hypothetical protein